MAARVSYELGTSNAVPIEIRNGRIILIDQRKIPDALEHVDATELEEMCFAIKHMIVRGAPAIGAAGALALAFEAVRLAGAGLSREQFFSDLRRAGTLLQATRPTAVNLSWDTNLVLNLAERLHDSEEPLDRLAEKLMECARSISEGYVESCRQIGMNGAPLVGQTASILTHCNAGALACCGWGTALGVIRAACFRGSDVTVYVDETRPRQQGSRLTAWELVADGITPVLITESMSGYFMSRGKIDLVVTGADRIATNGDAANKIGTYSLAVLAQAHGVPFYIAAPLSTIDPDITSGEQIPIEERDSSEVTMINGAWICPREVTVINPAFDVTPARLITGIITEAGVLRPPYTESIPRALSSRSLPV